MDNLGLLRWVLFGIAACHPDAPRPAPNPSTTSGSTPTGTGDTGTRTTTTTTSCAVTGWQPLVDRSSLRPCSEFTEPAPGCFPGELCADVCRAACGDGDCPSGETCEVVEWTTTWYDPVAYSLSVCTGASGVMPEGPLNGLSAFVPTSLPEPASLLVAGESALWTVTSTDPRVLALDLGPDHLPDGTLTDLGPCPVDRVPTAGLESRGRLYLVFGDRVFSAAVKGNALGAWREEAALAAAVEQPALLDTGDRLVVAAGSIDGAPSPLVQSAEVDAGGVLAPWTRTFVTFVGGPGRHAAVVANELVVFDERAGSIRRAPVSTLPNPVFELAPTPDDLRFVAGSFAVGSLCDSLVLVGAEPSLSTELLPWDPTTGPDDAWRLASIVSEEWRPPRDTTTHGSSLYVLGFDGTKVWAATRTP
ncbi:MAG: hypothetical protein H6738_03105 [Alphaproteobacteria bacterium]|nr:hypothetical protein [Alphaproteobacteria bacterium]MCB9695758.1 hypothetical protein [Alphaproteobacteria bacterium]